MTAEHRLRILYVANARSIHTQRWVGWFAKRHDVLLVSVPACDEASFRRPDIPLARGVPPYRVPLLSSLRITSYLRRTIADFRPDVVHAHSLVPHAWLAVATGFRPVVTTAWGSDLLLARGLARRLNRWAIRRAALNTADSRDAVERLLEIAADPSRVQLVQFGVDTSAFSPEPASGELLRSWQIPEGARVLVSPRILKPLYNGLVIARAFARVAPRHPELHLVILTFGADAAYQAQVEAELRAAGCFDRVRFAASVPHHLMPELYRSANAVLSVPSSDTTPVTVLEAMGCGCEVVASDLPALREWITHGVDGFLVPPGDDASLAKAIEEVLELSPERRARVAAQNRAKVVERASQDREMSRLEQSLLALVKAR